MLRRTLTIDIEMEGDKSAMVTIDENETGFSTTMVYDGKSVESGEFNKWLCNEVESWISIMKDEVEE